MTEAAEELGATPAQVALAWLLHRAPNVVPVPGTSSAHHLEENLAARHLHLTAEQVDRITAATMATPST